MEATVPQVKTQTNARRKSRRRQNTLPLHLMLLPAVILTLIFKYGPMFGVVIAFQDFTPVRIISLSMRATTRGAIRPRMIFPIAM